jgi:type VI secretion system protein ImpF
LLDRLMVSRRGKKSLRYIREFVAKDLEELLNTRCRCELLPEGMEELEESLVNYGLPDFSGTKMTGSLERNQLRRLLKDTIRRFESRLLHVNVTLIENSDASDPRLHFRIDAKLDTQPSPEPVVFDSHLEPTTATIQVE